MGRVKKATELSELDVLEISLVKRGANKKTFALFKSEANNMRDLTAAILAAPGDSHPELTKEMVVKGLSKEARSTVEDAVKLLSAVKEELSADLYKQISDALGLRGLEEEKAEAERDTEEEDEPREDTPPSPPAGELEEEEKAEGAAEPPLEAEAEKGPMQEDEESNLMKEISKSDDPRIAALFKANKDLAETIKKHESEKREKAFIEKAQSHFATIPGATPDQVGVLLRDIDDLSPDLSSRVEGILKATDAFAKNSGLFSEAGNAHESILGNSDASNQLNQMAKQRLAKTGESFAVAYEKVLHENSNLYNELVGIKD